MTPNNDHNINPEPSQESETPIDAEIIAEIEVDPYEMDQTEETVISLTAYPSRENYEERHESLDPLPQWFNQTLISLSTSWGLGSLCLVLGANLTIVGVQLWTIYQTPDPQPSTNSNPDASSLSLSIPKSLNLARKSPNTLILDGLSTVATPDPSQPSPQKVVKASPPSQTPTQTVVYVNQPPSLTNAILPPSLQPQSPANVTSLKVPQTPRTTPSPSLPVGNIPRPVPSVTIAPPPPPHSSPNSQVGQNPTVNPITLPTINQAPLSPDEQVRQTIQQQLQMKDNNQSSSPLGFNHKTRLQLQQRMNQLPPDSLPQQIKQLEQLQRIKGESPRSVYGVGR